MRFLLCVVDGMRKILRLPDGSIPTSSQAAFLHFPICLKNRLSSWLECSRKTRFRLCYMNCLQRG